MIDSVARARGRQLLNEFTAGRLTYSQLDVDWPSSSDRALKAIISTVGWYFDSDYVPTRVSSSTALEPRQLLERCALFLASTQEYAWSREPFARSMKAGLQKLLTFGMVRTQERKEEHEFQAEGDTRYWPFLNAAEWESCGEALGKKPTKSNEVG
jgi:hypothetical protein